MSHGICSECLTTFGSDSVQNSEFLEALEGPVMLVDTEGRAIGANSRLAGLVHRDPSSVAEHLTGEILSCVNATLPGGCGRTEHCEGCGIRQAVEATRTTGVPAVGIPIFATITGPGGPVRMCFSLSLERVGTDAVLVRIDGARPAPSSPVTGLGLKIVVADDDAGVRRYIGHVLRGAGCHVFEASNGREAAQRAIAEQVDIVITDLVMPEQEGIETVRQLRRTSPTLGIIAISGAFGGVMLDAARLLGAHATLSKPFTPGQLLEAVNRVRSSLQAP